MSAVETLFKDFCELHNRAVNDVLLEATNRYYSKPDRMRPQVMTADTRKAIMKEYLDSRQTLMMNLYSPCHKR